MNVKLDEGIVGRVGVDWNFYIDWCFVCIIVELVIIGIQSGGLARRHRQKSQFEAVRVKIGFK